MTMQISIEKNPSMTIYFHGIMKLPQLTYESEYRWTCTLYYMSGNDSFTVNGVTWDPPPQEEHKGKAEKRIGDLCVRLWNKQEQESHKDIIQYHDPGDEQEREYTVADLDADGDIPEPTTADEFNKIHPDSNVKRYKEKRVQLNRRHFTRRTQP